MFLIRNCWLASVHIKLYDLHLVDMAVEVRVKNLDCDGCAAKIRKALFKLKGVEIVDIDVELQKVTVRGYGIEEKKVVKAVRVAGKLAEPWPFPEYSHSTSFYMYPNHICSQYYYYHGSSSTAEVRSFFGTPAAYSSVVASDQAAAALFSDENPHACSIM